MTTIPQSTTQSPPDEPIPLRRQSPLAKLGHERIATAGVDDAASCLLEERVLQSAGKEAVGSRFSAKPRIGRLVSRSSILPIKEDYRRIKRLMDLAVCLLLLPVVLPVLAVCAAMVWLEDSRPVFFTQWRTGRCGRRFKILKLRTMVRNAAELKQKYAHLNELKWPDFKIRNDPRITRVGRFLRKTSLDELPQIFNVLKGQMSLVGPRPSSYSADTYALWQTERFEALPGITGLSQVNGRSDVGFDDKQRWDIEYVKKRSVWLDMRILFRTAGVVFGARGAY